MINSIINVAKIGIKGLKAGFPIGIKAMKYFVDSTFREKVTPVPGSALYCDLWVAVEHSGIYLDNGEISNIVVGGFAECSIQRNNAKEFTSKSTMGRKIYVSSNKHGAVGHEEIAMFAQNAIGERSFYGLVIKNCHQFSTRCIQKVDPPNQTSLLNLNFDSIGSWEPTLLALKASSRKHIGATKWLLWDWEGENVPVEEPDWNASHTYFSNLPLNKESMKFIELEDAQIQHYLTEISDENIPDNIVSKISCYRQLLKDIKDKYTEAKEFLNLFPDAGFSFEDLKQCQDDFSQLAKTIQKNKKIKELVRKMGRNYISEFKKKQAKVLDISKSEVYGAHQSSDVMRLLPNELVNLDDDTLEILFYARLLENNLLTYELAGSSFKNEEINEESKRSTGPIVACLDTSASMSGEPILKAKALLLVISNILAKEHRSLHILLFGAAGDLKVLSINNKTKANEKVLLTFLQQSFSGGTDFETPLAEAFKIIESQDDYKKADILMLSDGGCTLSAEFIVKVKSNKKNLGCMVYSVLCNGLAKEDEFSDEIMVI